ncbi:response regulator transcription factor [Paenibacillus sp. DMB20]|uniref:response regulator transcription factor n=1 Tax=Paenibacillus sp. DMB20 TaxID=1642570 RepID=UPI0006280806|nr:response regulator transcription factor [Paenibacillus sp. DMB20]KKO55509.1 transcriptional regulator [Paenibacillus sp. DMB20]
MDRSIMFAVSDQERAERITGWLEKAGYTVIQTDHMDSALSYARQKSLDMVIVDSRLQGMNDFDLLHTIQTERQGLPLIVLGNDGSEEAAASLEAGAHDYISPEADEREVAARVGKLLLLFEMGGRQKDQKIEIGDLTIDPPSRQVSRGGKAIELTQREYELLLYLTQRRNEVCSRDEILMHVWDFDFHTGTNVVDVYILHLREKLDRGHKWKLIRTVRGAGYMLKPPETDA